MTRTESSERQRGTDPESPAVRDRTPTAIPPTVTRRAVLAGVGAGAAISLAGCLGSDDGNGDGGGDESDEGDLVIVDHEYLPADPGEQRSNGLIVANVENAGDTARDDVEVGVIIYDEAGNEGDMRLWSFGEETVDDGDTVEFEIELANEDEEFMDDYEIAVRDDPNDDPFE